MLDVLFLLAITRGFLQTLDHETGSRGHRSDRRLAVGNSNLNTEAETFVFLGSIDDIVVDLLGRLYNIKKRWEVMREKTLKHAIGCHSYHTEGTDFLGQSCTSTFTTDGADKDYIIARGLDQILNGWMARI